MPDYRWQNRSRDSGVVTPKPRYPFKEAYVMTYVVVRFTVEDLAKWKTVFEEAARLRKSFGSMGVRGFSKADSPNEVMILAEYESREKAQQMFQSEEFREATARAVVKGPPEVSFLEEVGNLPA